MMAGRRRRLPLYAQIKQRLEQDLRDKKVRPGDRLPSEAELAAQLGASRLTVRRAIDELIAQGRLERVQGRGTFVVEPAPTVHRALTRWSFERIGQDERVTKRLLSVQELSPTFRVSNALRMMPAEPVVELTYGLERDGKPLGYMVARIPKLIVPQIQTWEPGGSLTQFLTREAGLELGKVEERVRAVPAEEEVAERLGVEPGSPLLYVDTLVFLSCGIPVILADTFYLGDRYELKSLLRPVAQQE